MTSQKLIEEIIRDAGGAPEPRGAEQEDIIHRANASLPATMVLGETTSAGHAYIWDTRTGERSITNLNMLRAQLQKRRPDGTLIFTTVEPAVKPYRGSMKCLLHHDQPERGHYDQIGLPTCRKANLPSEYMVQMHMRRKHRVEWETIQDERNRAERAREREFQEVLLTSLAKGQGVSQSVPSAPAAPGPLGPEVMRAHPLYVSDKPPKPRK